MAAQPTLRIMYLDLPGLGEAMRLALTLGGLTFEDERIEPPPAGPQKARASGRLPAGCDIPCLFIDEKPHGIGPVPNVKKCGELAIFNGTSLYPADPAAARPCDEVLDMIEDARVAVMSKIFGGQDMAMKALGKGGDAAEKWALIDKCLEGRKWCAGDTMTVADLFLFTQSAMMTKPSFLEFFGPFPEDALGSFANVKRVRAKVAALPAVVNYYQGRDGNYAGMLTKCT